MSGVTTSDAHNASSRAVLAAARAAPVIALRAADAVPAATWASRSGRARGTAVRLAGRDGNVAVKEMEDFGAAVRGGDADVRDGFADADGAGEANSRGTTNADDAVSLRDPLDGVVDDLGLDVDDGRVENLRVEVGDEVLDVAGRGHARGADDNQGRRQAQAAQFGWQTDNGAGAVDDAGGWCGGRGRWRRLGKGGLLAVRPSGVMAIVPSRPLAGRGRLSRRDGGWGAAARGRAMAGGSRAGRRRRHPL